MKKNISLFLVISLLAINCVSLRNAFGKERRGANLKIWKKDGRLINGELIAVKENSLLLLDTEGKDVNIEIYDIATMVIKKKSKPGKGAKNGLLIGGGIGLFGLEDGIANGIKSAIAFGIIGAGFGAIIGPIPRIKTIKTERMTDSEIQKLLDKLRKHARIRDYE